MYIKRLILAVLFSTGAQAAHPEGEYIARVADCMACHTAPGGEPMAGGKKFATPLGNIYSTNITPDKTHGIGGYSYEAFARAVREGIAKDGHPLYPAMPYPAYARLSDRDLHALYDYFMQDVTPSARPNRESDIPWLLSARWPLHIWNALFIDDPVPAPSHVADTGRAARIARGAYLVEGPGHCGACHTPRGVAMQEKGFTHKDEAFLSGAMIDGWYAPSLRDSRLSAQEMTSMLLTGKSQHDALSGSMAEVVSESTQYLTQQDAAAISDYLQSLRTSHQPSPQVARRLSDDSASGEGKVLFGRYCATCHGDSGKGSDFSVPSLVNNPVVMADEPGPLIRIIADGAQTPAIRGQVSFGMPAYGEVMKDEEMRDLVNYVRQRWGQTDAPVSASDVADSKKEARNAGH